MEMLINVGYLVSAVLFIFGIKGMSSPKTAVRGNQMGAAGMLVAVICALLDHQVISYGWIFVGLIIGGFIGAYMAKKVAMTEMPEMVAALNGFGGAASLLVAAANYAATHAEGTPMGLTWSIAILLSILIGAVTLTGSVVAIQKLRGKAKDPKDIKLYKLGVKGGGVLLLILAIMFLGNPLESEISLLAIIAISLAVGFALVMPIGGADMPVVISLLNSYSGLAGAATGFVLVNTGLIITGSLVGSAGLILTAIMCKAMNRSLTNVLFGGALADQGDGNKGDDADFYDGKIKTTGPEELAMILDSANSVIFVPGYGLAVAQAHHATKELADLLESRGVDVKYAIHPVAGRMPGHMNVLLAEANVPYEQLVEMEAINPKFPMTDVAIVLGANDVTNPSAVDEPGSPIYGMPILEVGQAKTVVVIKRSLSPGFAGIPNSLFTQDNTLMMFGDAREMQEQTSKALKEL